MLAGARVKSGRFTCQTVECPARVSVRDTWPSCCEAPIDILARNRTQLAAPKKSDYRDYAPLTLDFLRRAFLPCR